MGGRHVVWFINVTFIVTLSVTLRFARLCSGLGALLTYLLCGVSAVNIFAERRVVEPAVSTQDEIAQSNFTHLRPRPPCPCESRQYALIVWQRASGNLLPSPTPKAHGGFKLIASGKRPKLGRHQLLSVEHEAVKPGYVMGERRQRRGRFAHLNPILSTASTLVKPFFM